MNKDWKWEAKKKTVIDNVLDLFYDTADFLKRNKHIQDIQNFFKKFKITKYNDKTGYISQKKNDIFQQIAISEIKEIKVENKVTKKKKTITTVSEPSIEQVMSALTTKTDYAKIITDAIVNGIMFIVVIVVGIYEACKYLITRLVDFIRLVAKLPFRQVFEIVFKFSIVIIAVGLAFYLHNHFKSTSTAQEYIDKRVDKLEKKVDEDFLSNENKIDRERKRVDKLESTAIVVKHEFVEYNIYDKNGNLHKGKKIR